MNAQIVGLGQPIDARLRRPEWGGAIPVPPAYETREKVIRVVLLILGTCVYAASLALMGAGLLGAMHPSMILVALGGFKLGNAMFERATRVCTIRDENPARPNQVPVAHAPLVVIRSPNPIDCTVSLLFKKNQFSPQQPIIPAPTTQTQTDDLLRYEWTVRASPDGRLKVEGTDQKVTQIWWECTRLKETNHAPKKPICVAKGEIRQFLTKFLEKKGMKESEYTAFVNFWNQKLNTDQSSPYFLVRPIDPNQILEYLPPIKIKSGEEEMVCHRHYFHFTPVEKLDQEVDSAELYVDQMGPVNPGEVAAFDVGGEVEGNFKESLEVQEAFNRDFAKRYIFVN